jgi:hypothetical protein
MNQIYANINIILSFIIYCISVYLVVRIAKQRNLVLKRWIFYGWFFHIFALIYLIVKKPYGVDDIST